MKERPPKRRHDYYTPLDAIRKAMAEVDDSRERSRELKERDKQRTLIKRINKVLGYVD